MKAEIRQRALELGFDECRFASAVPPEGGAHFRQWLATGRHGEMAYLARNAHKRVDPQLVLPGAQSIIALAASYFRSKREGRGDEPTGATVRHPPSAIHNPQSGVVARYARFDDYHDVLGERLQALTLFVNQLGGPDTRSLWYVDTGPVLERDFAQRAGLGFIGKHTNVISRRLGNWVFLAEILTMLALEPDPPEKNRCGSCARCIAACPTQAILAPFTLDARRCISYLTIELKGSIPLEFRAAIGHRIFGCDDCLEVCPWNRFAQEGRLMKDRARPELATPDLIDLLALDEAAFKRRFRGTPLARVKRRGLLRNVCVALGNVGDASALPALERAGREFEPIIAEHARWAIEQIQRRSADTVQPASR
jgi:epoxyqueuosine reductase